MAKKQVEEEPDDAGVASLDPGEMLQGGLKDDFRGVVTEAVYARWDYDGNIDEPVLAARLTIQPKDDDGEDDGDPFVQHWSAGSLETFVPSADGKTPCDDDEAGPYALRVGKRAQLNNNTNFAHLMGSIIDSGEASKKFKRSDLTASLACLESLDSHWDRVPQKKRSGLVEAEGDGAKRARDVLVVTSVFGYGENGASAGAGKAGKGAKSAPPAKTAAAKSTKAKAAEPEEEEEPEVDELDSDIRDAVIEAISAAKGKLKKSKVPGVILAAMAKDPRKAKAVKRSSEADFIENGPWEYDEETGILSIE